MLLCFHKMHIVAILQCIVAADTIAKDRPLYPNESWVQGLSSHSRKRHAHAECCKSPHSCSIQGEIAGDLKWNREVESGIGDLQVTRINKKLPCLYHTLKQQLTSIHHWLGIALVSPQAVIYASVVQINETGLQRMLFKRRRC